jgi:hypothetical protein
MENSLTSQFRNVIGGGERGDFDLSSGDDDDGSVGLDGGLGERHKDSHLFSQWKLFLSRW